ncbi:MAG: MATE family efflux transporter [Gammaproteobacteria bacterium TMED1]|nr:MAG: MATE family efflux transporter [Gammaproteobacteria bacterium TMED1]|tara:strand:+ start:1073 stop:2473 length:1401 start_codon:yes stop_codon:yes gene_type:complete
MKKTDGTNEGSSDNDLTVGPITRHIVRLTGFLMLSMISYNVATLVETIYIGMVGTNELAAISFTFPVVMILQSVAFGLSVGAGSVAARTIGGGDTHRVKRLSTHCLLLVTVLSSLIGAVAYFFLTPIFIVLGASEQVLPLVVSYMTIWLLGMPIFAMTNVGITLMRSTGDAVSPGYLSALGALLHIGFAPLFIFGVGPFPEMGLQGAALSFVIARFLEILVFFYFFALRDKMMLLGLKGFKRSVGDMLHVGLPAIAANLIVPVSMAVITRLLAGHGTAVVAGFGVAMRIEFMTIMVIFAVSISLSPIVGQNWGARLYDRVKVAMRTANVFVIGWGILSYLILVVFGHYFVGIINDDPLVQSAAYDYLRVGPLAVGLMGVIFNATHCFNALGKPMPPLVLSLLRMIIIKLPIILVGNYFFGYMGIFIGTVITTGVVAIISSQWVNHTIDRRIERSLTRLKDTALPAK